MKTLPFKLGTSAMSVLFVIPLLIATLTIASAAVATDPKSTKAVERYKLTVGKGHRFCESYLKHLNALPANEPPPVCEAKLSPKYKDYTFPAWETLDWMAHLDWIFQMEQQLYAPTPNDAAAKTLTFEDWKKIYLTRVEEGVMKPRIRRSRITLNEHGGETILDYDRHLNQCRDLTNTKYGAVGGSRYFVLLEGATPKIEVVEDLIGDLLVFEGRAYFIGFEQYGRWEADIKVVYPRASIPDPNAKKYIIDRYGPKVCQYRLNTKVKE